jgi:hypothetical protein
VANALLEEDRSDQVAAGAGDAKLADQAADVGVHAGTSSIPIARFAASIHSGGGTSSPRE